MISNLVNAIVEGFNGILSGFGNGVTEFFKKIFLEYTESNGTITYSNNLSTFATVALVMIGVGMAIGIARWVIHKVG